jgi:hypothetical protein
LSVGSGETERRNWRLFLRTAGSVLLLLMSMSAKLNALGAKGGESGAIFLNDTFLLGF